MNKSTITRERLEELAAGQSSFNLRIATHEESQELARMVLATLDSEPVALQPELAKVIYHFRDWNEGFPVERFKADYVISWMLANYPPAQPAPVVPDDVLNRLEHEANHITAWHHMDEHSCKVNRRDLLTLVNSFRSAMLQAVPITNEEDIALHNYRTALEGIGHIRRTLEETFGGLHGTHVEPDVLIECKTICDAIYAAYSGSSQGVPEEKLMPNSLSMYAVDTVAAIAEVRGWNACRTAMRQESQKSAGASNNCRSGENVQDLQAGNSPVIPDGYVMVPIEPTEAMCDISHIGVDVYCGITDDNEYYSIGGAEAAKVWKAMLAAAPQEVKP